MGDEGFGPWAPLSVGDAAELFGVASFRWWLSGGHALEMHLGRSCRAHDDTDIGVCRDDVPAVAGVLSGWDLHVAAAGVLTPWAGGPLSAERSENNLWCRPTPSSPWRLDVTIGDGTPEEWIYRRDRTIRRPWAGAVLVSRTGVPHLAPELQLLFK
ncbi:MAG: amino acid transporter, partial [Actinomycetota bacterium]